MFHTPRRRDERGATTAEYSVGTIGAVLVASCIYRVIGPMFGRLKDPPFDLHELLERALGPLDLADFLLDVLPWA